MDTRFKDAIKFVMRWEGGLVDHPSDPGGLTNFGIALKKNPQLTRDDVLNMTEVQAMKIYYENYWKCAVPDYLPDSAACLIFDSSVNQGSSFARKCLQRAAGAVADGVYGAKTRQKVLAMSERRLCLEIAVLRALHYARLSIFKTFGKGWMRRLFSCYAVALAKVK